jgi:hypothetical protein
VVDSMVAALGAFRLPGSAARANAPAVVVNGETVSASGMAEALTWALAWVRAVRRGATRGQTDYYAGLFRMHHHNLCAVSADLPACLTAINQDGAAALDAALCDAIERIDRDRGCGWYEKMPDGRMVLRHRPAAFAP